MFKINSLYIKNFKSIVNVSMKDLSSFLIFLGANGVGSRQHFKRLRIG